MDVDYGQGYTGFNRYCGGVGCYMHKLALVQWYTIFSVFRDVILNADENCLILSLGLAVFCKRYAMVVRCVPPSNGHRIAKNVLVNCTPLSVKKNARMPYGTSQL